MTGAQGPGKGVRQAAPERGIAESAAARNAKTAHSAAAPCARLTARPT
ncbi:hypothetical protein ABZ614_02455 [Streptomyces sp. NPDC013178]